MKVIRNRVIAPTGNLTRDPNQYDTEENKFVVLFEEFMFIQHNYVRNMYDHN